jgi:hypothetical protein
MYWTKKLGEQLQKELIDEMNTGKKTQSVLVA